MGENGQKKVIERQVYQTLKRRIRLWLKDQDTESKRMDYGDNCSAGDHVCDHFL